MSLTYAYVKQYIEIDSNSGFVFLEDKYVDVHTKMKMICKNGHLNMKTFNNFKVGKRCRECYYESIRGEKSRHWNPKLSDDERITGRQIEGYNNWIYSVFERDNYVCQCCGKKSSADFNAHHMDGYNWCKNRRTDVSNGVLLCGVCHTKFHQEYGFGDNTETQFLYWIINNGIGIFDIDQKKMESVLLIKPEIKEPFNKKAYARRYYEENERKYSKESIDRIFNEMKIKNVDIKFYTMVGFKKTTEIHPTSVTGVLKMPWTEVLRMYNIRDELFDYVCHEYEENYLSEYKCSFEVFTKEHEYITQDLIKQFTMEKIKKACGFNGSFQQHNLKGLKKNFNEVKFMLGRIPFYNEFQKLSKISLSPYYNFFNTTSFDELILNFDLTTSELAEYYINKNIRIKQIASVGGKNSSYTEEEKEIEFRKVFDSYFNQFNKYPNRRQFNELSKFSEKAFMKKYNRSWSQAVAYYGYPTKTTSKSTSTG